jgi:hypothetical protein
MEPVVQAQVPPQPLLPQELAAQVGAQQVRFVVQIAPVPQPQVPPHPSGPQVFGAQAG